MGSQVSISTPHEGPTELLEGRDIPSIAKYIKSEGCRKIFVMLGAGVSTAAGIPDFRSPGTGLYSNLARLNLPYPEAVFEINYFRKDPLPFYTLARELYPGRFRPTLTHTFVKLLADHAFLETCFTQNIDTLERQAGVPGERVVEAHGSFADQHCIECEKAYDGAKMRDAIEKGEIVRCARGGCGGLVKPDIVFFGESLPARLHQTYPKLREADLVFVIGTSLKVQPFASLTAVPPESCPRVLINMERVGDIGTRPDDVVLLGRCDEVIRELCRALGWEEELEREWAKTEVLVPLDALSESAVEKVVDGTVSETAADEEVAERKDLTDGEAEPSVKKAEAPLEAEKIEAELEKLTARAATQALSISESEGARPSVTETVGPVPETPPKAKEKL